MRILPSFPYLRVVITRGLKYPFTGTVMWFIYVAFSCSYIVEEDASLSCLFVASQELMTLIIHVGYLR
jgi:hypothetical protein